MRRYTAEAKARSERTNESLPAFWVAIYLVALLVVSVAAGTLLARHQVGGAGEVWRLLPMLLVGELVIYLVILVVPGERIVPPGRALFGVVFGMVIRALMAFLTASALRLSDPSASQSALMAQVYAARWFVALMQMLLVLFYLWLIREALESERLRPPVRRAQKRVVEEAREDVLEAEQRRQRLLNALHERREQEMADSAAPAEPEPLPEPVIAAPVVVAPEPEPTIAAPVVVAPEPEPAIAEPVVVAPEPEPVIAAPVAVAPEPEPAAVEPEPEPEPEPDPGPQPEPEPAAAPDDTAALEPIITPGVPQLSFGIDEPADAPAPPAADTPTAEERP